MFIMFHRWPPLLPKSWHIKIPYRGWSMILTVCCCSLFIHIQCTCTEHPDHTCGPEAVSQSEYALDRNLYERLKVHRTVKSRFFNGWPWCGWSIYKFGVKKKHIVGKLASDTKTLVMSTRGGHDTGMKGFGLLPLRSAMSMIWPRPCVTQVMQKSRIPAMIFVYIRVFFVLFVRTM